MSIIDHLSLCLSTFQFLAISELLTFFIPQPHSIFSMGVFPIIMGLKEVPNMAIALLLFLGKAKKKDGKRKRGSAGSKTLSTKSVF